MECGEVVDLSLTDGRCACPTLLELQPELMSPLTNRCQNQTEALYHTAVGIHQGCIPTTSPITGAVQYLPGDHHA